MDEHTQQTTTPAPDQTTKLAVKRFRKWMIIGVCIVIGLILAPFIYTSVMLYSVKTSNSATDMMTTWVPFPAAIVNGQWLSYHDYQKDVQDSIAVAQKFAADPSFSAQYGTVPSNSDIAQQEYDRMIDSMILKQVARKDGVTASADDIDAAYKTNVLSQVQGDETQVATTLQQLYGWTIDQFKANVISELVLRQKLGQYLLDNNDPDYTKAAHDQIVSIQAQVQTDPTKFADLAKQYSQDGSATSGGDLGFFSKGQMVKPFEDAAFALTTADQVSDIVQSQFGYHLIQFIERKDATDADPEQVHARHILIKFSIDDYLKIQRDAAQVRELINPGEVIHS